MKKSLLSPGLVLAVGIFAASTSSVFIRYAQTEAPSLVIAAYRLALATLILLPLAWLRHRDELRRLQPTDWGWAGLSGLFLALHFATWITSLEYTTVASSVVLVSTSPLWVALVSGMFLGERLTRRALAGLGLAVVGGIVVSLSDAGSQATGRAPLLGNGLAMAGAWAVTGYLLIGRRLRARLSLLPYVTLVYGSAAVALLAMVGVSRQPLTSYPPPTYLWFLLLALLPQLIGHSSFNWALAYLPATFVAVATLGEPIGSTLLAYLLLGETPTLLKLAGAALILTGIVLTLRSQTAGE